MSSNFPTHYTDIPNMTIRPSNHEIPGPLFSQTRECFDIEDEGAIDDESDESEGGFEIEYKKTTKKYLETTKEDKNPKPNRNNQDNNSNHPPSTTTNCKTHQEPPNRPSTPPQTSPQNQSSTPPSPTTDDLLQYATETRLLAIEPPISQGISPPVSREEIEDLARLRAVITRTRDRSLPLSNSNPSPSLSPSPNRIPLFPATKIRDFAPFAPPLRNPPQAPFTSAELPIKDVPEYLPSPTVEEHSSFLKLPHLLPQDAAHPLHGNIPDTPLISGLESPDLSDLASFANEMNLFEGLGPGWARSPQVSEGFRPILTDGEERIDESLVLPLSPVWGNLGSLNGLGEGVLIDDAVSLSEPISNLETSPQRTFSDESFAIGSVSDSSKNLAMPVVATLRRGLSEGNELGPLHLPLISKVNSHTHTSSSDSPSNTQFNLDIWFETAYAIGVPAKASHHLTANTLRHLCEDTMTERSVGYTKSEISQGALRRAEILAWINSGALDHGIDGDTNGRPFIVSLPSVWGSEVTDYWSFEYVDMYWRAQPGKFGWVMDWVQNVEGSPGDGESLTDEVYDFFGEDEEIIHRSVSEPEEDIEGLSENGQDDSLLIDPTSRPNPRLQMISDLFRVRELRRLRMDDGSPMFPMTNPKELKKNRGPGEKARTKALNLSERIARDANQRQKRLMDDLFPRVIPNQLSTIEGILSELSGPIKMGAFLGPQVSERDDEASQDPATKNGPSPTEPGTGDLFSLRKNNSNTIPPLN